VLAIALALESVAFAPAAPDAPASVAQQSSSTAPLAIPTDSIDPALAAAIRENPLSCDSFVPAGVTVRPDVNATLVSYRITFTGEVRDVALYRSRGNADLDSAAIACVNKWRMLPQMVAGKPAELSSVIGVLWNLQNHAVKSLSPDGSLNMCGIEWFPRAAIRRGVNTSTDVSYRVAADGSVKNAAVLRSSDGADLDQAALDCVATWRFFPTYEGGTPVERDGSAEIYWRTR
jgi:TonB family protein